VASWTEAEDAVLIELRGKKVRWAKVCKDPRLNNRSRTSCENRWYMLVHGREVKCMSKDGEALSGEFYIFSVPEGDPLLQALEREHGKDAPRNVDVRPSVPRRMYGESIAVRSGLADF
jgi:hypothetical protein